MQINRKLRIAIDCRIGDPNQGVGTAIIALAKALSDSQVADQEYTFIVQQEKQDWLAPYIFGPCRLAPVPTPKSSFFRKVLKPIAPLRFVWHRVNAKRTHVPASDGYVETQNFDVVHFPTQLAYLTDLPSIYQPWDLQHIHYPQFFSQIELTLRERYYRAFCNRASFVCVQAEWTKQDVMHQYGIAEEKIAVIPWGSVFHAYKTPSAEQARATVEKYNLPDQFLFYPAVTWPHKNHACILRALSLLKSKHGSRPHVYFTGSSTEYRSALDKLGQEIGVSDQIHFLGFLTSEELQAVFGAATAMVFPSKFEGFGLPILEAFHAKLPVLSSRASTLPEVAQDAALYFDPDSPQELASLLKTILDAPEVRQELIAKGTYVLNSYSMNDTAASFQALYKRTAALSSQDHHPLHPVSAATS